MARQAALVRSPDDVCVYRAARAGMHRRADRADRAGSDTDAHADPDAPAGRLYDDRRAFAGSDARANPDASAGRLYDDCHAVTDRRAAIQHHAADQHRRRHQRCCAQRNVVVRQ